MPRGLSPFSDALSLSELLLADPQKEMWFWFREKEAAFTMRKICLLCVCFRLQ